MCLRSCTPSRSYPLTRQALFAECQMSQCVKPLLTCVTELACHIPEPPLKPVLHLRPMASKHDGQAPSKAASPAHARCAAVPPLLQHQADNKAKPCTLPVLPAISSVAAYTQVCAFLGLCQGKQEVRGFNATSAGRKLKMSSAAQAQPLRMGQPLDTPVQDSPTCPFCTTAVAYIKVGRQRGF